MLLSWFYFKNFDPQRHSTLWLDVCSTPWSQYTFAEKCVIPMDCVIDAVYLVDLIHWKCMNVRKYVIDPDFRQTIYMKYEFRQYQLATADLYFRGNARMMTRLKIDHAGVPGMLIGWYVRDWRTVALREAVRANDKKKQSYIPTSDTLERGNNGKGKRSGNGNGIRTFVPSGLWYKMAALEV